MAFVASLAFTILLINYSLSLNCDNVEVCRETQHPNCEHCIRTHPCCSWCSDMNFEKVRCDTNENLKQLNCSSKFIFDAGNSMIISEMRKPFSNADEVLGNPAVQIDLQEIDISLRLHEPVTFKLKYQAAKNYPLDLYYLMDLTYSMKDDLEAMISLGSTIGSETKMLTNKYKIGFGYYSDKVAMPFAMMDKKSMENPCSGLRQQCAKGFDFIHALNFTENVNDFIQKLKESEVTANVDDLEGGIDAIMQIITCQNYMRWRKFSRKIVVVATGGFMHFAGDGVLSGSIQKNPGVCMLDENGAYNSLIYDYPSLEEIHKKLQEEKVNLLFAAKKEAYNYYEKFHNTIPDVSTIGKLEEKSTNIMKLIKDSYQKVVQTVKFEANVTDNVKITFETTCKPTGKKRESNQCKNVKIGEKYIFDVTLELIKLPENHKTKDTFVIEEMNLFEYTKINVNYIGVECNCMESGVQSCKHGAFKCGICNCKDGWTGRDCSIECMKEHACRFSNETYTSSTCFGKGDCDLSTCSCQCDRRYTGQFCEFNQCPRNRRTGEICTSEKHGTCDRGTCVCNENYNGTDCSCYMKNDTCLAPGQNKLCNGAGQCVCGKCECQEGHSGQFCEYCPECDAICSSFEQCVIGVSLNNTVDNCIRNGTKYETKKNDLAEDLCLARYINEKGETCDVQYSYAYEAKNVILEYRNALCSRPLTATSTGILIFSAILAVGLATIIIVKVKNSIQDKRELAKHEKEVLLFRSKREDNPLYHSPITQHVNPLRQLEEDSYM
nr:integrin beta-nu-like [Onthophagus taurus]